MLAGIIMAACRELFLVLYYLTIQFVDQGINCSVQVFIIAFHENIFAADVYSGFGLLLKFLNGKDDIHVYHVVEVTFEFAEFPRCIIANGGGDFQMASG